MEGDPYRDAPGIFLQRLSLAERNGCRWLVGRSRNTFSDSSSEPKQPYIGYIVEFPGRIMGRGMLFHDTGAHAAMEERQSSLVKLDKKYVVPLSASAMPCGEYLRYCCWYYLTVSPRISITYKLPADSYENAQPKWH